MNATNSDYSLRDMLAVFYWNGFQFVVEVCGHEIARLPVLKQVRALVEQHNARLAESLS